MGACGAVRVGRPPGPAPALLSGLSPLLPWHLQESAVVCFKQGSPPVPSRFRASCWPSLSSERRWRRCDAMCGTRRSTPRSTAGSRPEVSPWARGHGLQLNHGPLTVTGAEFKAWAEGVPCSETVAQLLGHQGGLCLPRAWQDSGSFPGPSALPQAL